VADFNNQSKWKEPWDLSVQIPDLLHDGLRGTGAFVVQDRTSLKSALEDLDLPAPEEEGALPGEPGGRFIPVQFLVTGTVTDFVYLQGKQSGGFGFGKFRIGGGKNVAFVSLVIRVMDTITGEVVDTKRIEGRGSRGKFSTGNDLEKITFGGEEFLKTPIGEALHEAMDRGIEFIERGTESLPFRSRVLAVREGRVYTDAGQINGVKKEEMFKVLRFPSAVYDPESGLRLTSKPQPIGDLTVESVQEKFSTGVSPQSVRIRRGDIVESHNP
jgi:curli biogenesis system outer membrane secretion channel CsgG